MYHLVLALEDVIATINFDPLKPGDDASIDQKIMDMDLKRFVEVHQKSLTKMYINENIKLYESRGSQKQFLS